MTPDLLDMAELLRLTREARRPSPTLYVVSSLTPDGAVYQIGKVAIGPGSLADGMASLGVDVLRGDESADYRAAMLQLHGGLAFGIGPWAFTGTEG